MEAKTRILLFFIKNLSTFWILSVRVPYVPMSETRKSKESIEKKIPGIGLTKDSFGRYKINILCPEKQKDFVFRYNGTKYTLKHLFQN